VFADSKIVEGVKEYKADANSITNERTDWNPGVINLDNVWKSTEVEANIAPMLGSSQTIHHMALIDQAKVNFRLDQEEGKKLDEFSLNTERNSSAVQEQESAFYTDDIVDTNVAEIEGQIAWEQSSVKSQEDEFEW